MKIRWRPESAIFDPLAPTRHRFIRKGGETRCVEHSQAAHLCVPEGPIGCLYKRSFRNGLYKLHVKRLAAYLGIIAISRKEQSLATCATALTGDATFGADERDIQGWVAFAAVIIEDDLRRRKG